LARPAITLVLLHGNMSAHGAHETANALIAFALGLPTFGLFITFMRAFQAMQDTRSMFVFYVVENALNVVLALLLYPSFGITGLAASWSLAYAGAAVLAGWNLSRRIQGIGGSDLAHALGSVLWASIPAAGVAWGLSEGLALAPGGNRQLGVAVRVVVAVVGAVSVYFIVGRRLRFAAIRKRLAL
jgi:putative peptidoglycan lipid II flippase